MCYFRQEWIIIIIYYLFFEASWDEKGPYPTATPGFETGTTKEQEAFCQLS